VQKANQQFYQFDVLRALAIIGVFYVHCQYAIYPGFDFSYGRFFIISPASAERFKYMSMSPFAFGWAGVILFFLISGFLIHYVTLVKGIENFKLGQFVSRRFWRIYPLFLIALLFFTFNGQSVRDVYHNPRDFLAHLFLVHNFSDKYIFSINGVFWSLAAEVQVYALYPVFLFISLKTNTKFTLLILFIIGLLTTFYWWESSAFKSISVGNSVLRLWFVWAFGAYLGECFYHKKRIFGRVSNFQLILLCLIFYFSKLLFIHIIFDIYFATIILAIIMEKYLYIKREVRLWEKALIPVGLCSYSIYLFHMPFLSYMYSVADIMHLRNHNKLAFFLVNSFPIFLFIFGLAYLSYLLLEQNSVKLGNFLYKKYFAKDKQIEGINKSKIPTE